MSKIFKPRRGTTYTMRSTNKKSTVLAKGEMFLEVPNTGVGTGPSKIIIGDGVTTFENLPIALSGTTTSDVTTDSSATISSALNNVIPGKEMSNLFGSLKQAISLNATAIAGLNDKVPFTLAISDGAYGYKNGSGTFIPFKSQADIDAAISAAKVGTATAAQVLTGYTFTNATTSGIEGSMPNQGKKTQSLNCGGSYTIPAGYHNGQGSITANSLASQTGVDSGKTAVTAGAMINGYQGWVNGNKISGTFTAQTKTVTSSRSNQTVSADSGKYLTSVTVNGLAPSGTYTASSRGATLDMGATSNYRYVNTNSVPNTNAATLTLTVDDLGKTKDMGATNTYRYVSVPSSGNFITQDTRGSYNIPIKCNAAVTMCLACGNVGWYSGASASVSGSLKKNGTEINTFSVSDHIDDRGLAFAMGSKVAVVACNVGDVISFEVTSWYGSNGSCFSIAMA